MSAKEALNLYKSRDTSEKLFRGDKSYLGDKSLRIYGDSEAESKIFIEFIALIIHSRIYNCLKDEMRGMEKRPNYMTVPAALRELDRRTFNRVLFRRNQQNAEGGKVNGAPFAFLVTKKVIKNANIYLKSIEFESKL